MSKDSAIGLSMSPMFLLFIVFLILKLTDTIDWSWWWVTSPLWIPLVFVLGIAVIAGIIALIIGIFVILIDLIP